MPCRSWEFPAGRFMKNYGVIKSRFRNNYGVLIIYICTAWTTVNCILIIHKDSIPWNFWAVPGDFVYFRCWHDF
jgi:hypothetical protein